MTSFVECNFALRLWYYIVERSNEGEQSELLARSRDNQSERLLPSGKSAKVDRLHSVDCYSERCRCDVTFLEMKKWFISIQFAYCWLWVR